MNLNMLKNKIGSDYINIFSYKLSSTDPVYISLDKENILCRIYDEYISEDNLCLESMISGKMNIVPENASTLKTYHICVLCDDIKVKIEGSLSELSFVSNDNITEIDLAYTNISTCPVLNTLKNLQTLILYDSNIENNDTYMTSIATALYKADNYRCIVVNDDASCVSNASIENKLIAKNWFYGSCLRYKQIHDPTSGYLYDYKKVNGYSKNVSKIPRSTIPTTSWLNSDGDTIYGVTVERTVSLNGVNDCNISLFASFGRSVIARSNIYDLYGYGTNYDDKETLYDLSLWDNQYESGFKRNKIEFEVYDENDEIVPINIDGAIYTTIEIDPMYENAVRDRMYNSSSKYNLISLLDRSTDATKGIPIYDADIDSNLITHSIASFGKKYFHIPKNASKIKYIYYFETTGDETEYLENNEGEWIDYDNNKICVKDKPKYIDCYYSSRLKKVDFTNTEIVSIGHYAANKPPMIILYNALDYIYLKHTGLSKNFDIRNNKSVINKKFSNTYVYFGDFIYNGNERKSTTIFDDDASMEVLVLINPLRGIAYDKSFCVKIDDNGEYIAIPSYDTTYGLVCYGIKISDYERYIFNYSKTEIVTKNGKSFDKICGTFTQDNNGNFIKVPIRAYIYESDIGGDNTVIDNYLYIYIGDIYTSIIDNEYINLTNKSIKRHIKQNNNLIYSTPYMYIHNYEKMPQELIATGIDRLWVSSNYGENRVASVNDQAFEFYNDTFKSMPLNAMSGGYDTYFGQKIYNAHNFINPEKYKFIYTNEYRDPIHELNERHGSMCVSCIMGNGHSGVYGTAPKSSVIGTNFALRKINNREEMNHITGTYNLIYLKDHSGLYGDLNIEHEFTVNDSGSHYRVAGTSYYFSKNKIYTTNGSNCFDYINILEHMDMIYKLVNGEYINISNYTELGSGLYYIGFPNKSGTIIYNSFSLSSLYIFGNDGKYTTNKTLIYKWDSTKQYYESDEIWISDGTLYGGYIYSAVTKNKNIEPPNDGSTTQIWECVKYVTAALYYLWDINNLSTINIERYDLKPAIDAYCLSFGRMWGYGSYVTVNEYDVDRMRYRLYDDNIIGVLAAGNSYASSHEFDKTNDHRNMISDCISSVYVSDDTLGHNVSLYNKVSDYDWLLEEYTTTPSTFLFPSHIEVGTREHTDDFILTTKSHGTSFSCPKYAGVVLIFKNILVKKLKREPTIEEVRDAIKENTISIANSYVEGFGVISIGAGRKNSASPHFND